MNHTLPLTAQLEALRAELSALDSDTPRLKQMVQDALTAVSMARAGLKASGDFDTLTLASGKHSALEGLLNEHLAEISTLRNAISNLEAQIQTLEREAQKQARFEHLQRAVRTLEHEKRSTLEALSRQVSETVDTFARAEKACNLAQREMISLGDGPKDNLMFLHPGEGLLQTTINNIHWPQIWERVRWIWGYQEREIIALLEEAGGWVR